VSLLRLAERREAPLGAERAPYRRRRRDPPQWRRRRRGLLFGRGVRLPQLAGLVERLASALAHREPARVVRPEARRAAVAVVVSREDDPALIFIRRKVREGDPWSGQMALPGGFQAANGESLSATAARETREETGLDLAECGRLLGALDDLSPRTPRLPPIIVSPHVFAVGARAPLVPGDEADEALWLLARDIFDPANRTTLALPLPGGERAFPAIEVGTHLVWGLTERILHQVATIAGA
jgi:ADP-ribose pyrophosphatase YjhB (NUDIX family)